MIAPRFIPLVWKQVVRHPVRSLLTVGGVTTARFLFVAVQAMQRGVHTATYESAAVSGVASGTGTSALLPKTSTV